MDHKCSVNMRKYQYSTRMKLHGAFKTQLNRKLCANIQRNISEILSFIHNRLIGRLRYDEARFGIDVDILRPIPMHWEPLSIYSHIHTAINRSSLFSSCISFSLALASDLFPFFVFFFFFYLSMSLSVSFSISRYLFSHFFSIAVIQCVYTLYMWIVQLFRDILSFPNTRETVNYCKLGPNNYGCNDREYPHFLVS